MSDRRYLQLQATKGLGPKTLTRLLLQLQRRGETVEDFFRASPAAWRSEYGLADKIVDALQAGMTKLTRRSLPSTPRTSAWSPSISRPTRAD